MADAKYVASHEGMVELLGSDSINAAVAECAANIRDRANAMVSSDTMVNDAFYSSYTKDSKSMARASVYTGNPHGYNACLSDNVLLKALG